MKVLVPFLLLTGVVWTIGLQSPEESDPSISYARTLPISRSFQVSSSDHLLIKQQITIGSEQENKPDQNALGKPVK